MNTYDTVISTGRESSEKRTDGRTDGRTGRHSDARASKTCPVVRPIRTASYNAVMINKTF